MAWSPLSTPLQTITLLQGHHRCSGHTILESNPQFRRSERTMAAQRTTE